MGVSNEKRNRYKDAVEIAKGNCSVLAIIESIKRGLRECIFQDKKDFKDDDAMILMVYYLQSHFHPVTDCALSTDCALLLQSVTSKVKEKNDLLTKKEQAKKRRQRNRRNRKIC